MKKNLKINVIIETKELSEALKRYLKYILGIKDIKMFKLEIENGIISTEDIYNTDMWIVEVYPPYDNSNPIGFRAIYKLRNLKSIKFLLIFPPLFPEFLKNLDKEGPFWWSACAKSSFLKKIKDILNSKGNYKQELEILAQKYPQLLYDPKKHH